MKFHHHRARSARRHSHRFARAVALCFLLTIVPSGWADVTYVYDDGSSERGIGIDPGEDSLWFNRFTVAPGGEVITSISAAFGRPGSSNVLNGLPIKVLLYEDADGGAPWNPVFKQSVNGVVA